MPDSNTPHEDRLARHEIRFAVVMYGGISLTVYMNGIAQEFLNLVRATAEDAEGKLRYPDLGGTTAIYRDLARILDHYQPRFGEMRMPVQLSADAIAALPQSQSATTTKFVVDILSGSSAGGINAVFLAKALANDQDLTPTGQLWVDEGDIRKLIYDKESLADTSGLALPDPLTSLLNGDRMLVKLFEAFHAMDGSVGQPLVKEIDLAVTTTDVSGRLKRLTLADGEVYEREHRHVFQFRLSPPDPDNGGNRVNTFTAEWNAALAHASRSTSSFPAAFAPVRLADSKAALVCANPPINHKQERILEWLFEECDETEPHYDSENRSFIDGGVLDNKPFSYAIDAIARRSGASRTSRKLVYIEPSPGHPERDPREHPRLDVAETLSASSSLPRAETIRQDLERVIKRNRLVERMVRFVEYADRMKDFTNVPALPYYGDARSFEARLQAMGPGFANYHRLRVASTMDFVAQRIVELAGFDITSPQYEQIRTALSRWRGSRFVYPTEPAQGRESELALLMGYDLDFRVRRLRLVRRMCERLAEDPRALHESLEAAAAAPRPQMSEQDSAAQDFGGVLRELYLRSDDDERVVALRRAIGRVKMVLDLALEDLLQTREMIGEASRAQASAILAQDEPAESALSEFMGTWHVHVEEAKSRGHEYCSVAFPGLNIMRPQKRGEELVEPKHLPQPDPSSVGQWLIWRYYRYYETYDVTAFPMLSVGTDIGDELCEIHLHRISPQDAKSVVNEEDRRHKLAGDALGHFGAFFGEDFRLNDLLWGRLDGAERLITMLIDDIEVEPASDRANLEAIKEELVTRAHERILWDALAGPALAAQGEATLEAWRKKRTELPDESDANSAYRAIHPLDRVGPTELREAFKKGFVVPEEIDPELALRSMARSTEVAGKVFEDIGERHLGGNGLGLWIGKLGRVFLALVQAAIPDSIRNRVARYWLMLLYLFEVVLIGFGVLFNGSIAQFGALMFGGTLLVHVTLLAVGDYLLQAKGFFGRLKRLAVIVAIFLLLVVFGLGIWKAIDIFNAGNKAIEMAVKAFVSGIFGG
ncbi:MAG TPA: patatin-like protein [Coriobacteriia bacterium]|nr:patatin-like protein [Coriobacteriia bacterium]